MSYYIIIRGPLGCGKTTIAKKLSKLIEGKHISIDKMLEKHNLLKDREEGYTSQKSFFKANDFGIKAANKYLSKGIPVIFDGNFYWKSQIEDLLKKLDIKHYVFTLQASLELCIERDSKRKQVHGKDAARVVHNKSTEFNYGKLINTENKTPQEVLKEIIKFIY
ncbi:AAA family ATPase [Candidatus Pacearchaeota archaeon]|nr:AAA family ATPase [Candidatus Pacearchaeota archaeon]